MFTSQIMNCLESYVQFLSFKGFIAIIALLISFFLHYDNNIIVISVPLPFLSCVF